MSTFDFGTIVRTHTGPLVLFVRQWVPNEADDVVHESFLRLAQLVRDAKTPENVVPWLYQVVRNEVIDRLRKKGQARKHAEIIAESVSWFTPPNVQETEFDARFLTEQLQKLPLEEREVIVAHLWGGLSFREIEKMTGRSFSTLRRQYHAGIKTLKEAFS